ncbi:sigma-70 family RNA polymerase sigma factor [Sphaerisporangium aureirubrum]|uniref:Sigma-70 family RNA polymerase sigma factor n=1 Tax=Sphaerisporangium aureirubrum TaxID=1544736 RepID=A0ABW1NL66_9ACTN
MAGVGGSGPDAALVAAARDGDRRALDTLVADSLPLVYNIVGRALGGHADVDDVVQETLLRVVNGLRGLRDTSAYRSWLVAIAVRQVRDHERDRRTARHRGTGLDTAEEVPDPASDFAAVTILRLGLTDQRREVAEATRWLDKDDRALLALWWLEETGELGRADLAAALGLSGRHAAVRVQRMKEQVQVARTVVRALGSGAGCGDLRELAWNWDGTPGPLWRKRFARHIHSCADCGHRTAGLLPVERLLGGIPLLPVPAAMIAKYLPSLSGPGAAHVGGVQAPPGDGGVTLVPGNGGAHTAGVRPGGGGAHRAVRVINDRPRGVMAMLSNGPVAGSAAFGGAVVVVAGVLLAGHLNAGPPAAEAAAPVVGSAPVAVAAATPSRSPAKRRAQKPTPAPTPRRTVAPAVSVKKGVGVWKMRGVSTALARSGAKWYYNWSTRHDGITTPRGARFVPMIWGAKSVDARTLAEARAAGPYLLGFNEPDMTAQSNMSVEQALALWPKLMKAGRVLGSPAVAFGGDTRGGWLDRFMSGAAKKRYRVDFITLHWYGGDFRAAAATGQLKNYLQAVYKRYRKPIWLTEYALIDFSRGARFPTDSQQAAFVTASTRMLAALPYVQRYAWFGLPAESGKPNSGLFRDDGTPTAAGRAFMKAR